MRDRLKQLPTRLSALLLIGGAFVFGLAYYVAMNYTVTTDSTTAFVPKTATAYVTLNDPAFMASELVSELDDTFSEVIQTVQFTEETSMSLFVYGRVDNEIQWGLVTDAEIDTPSLPEGFSADLVAENMTIVSNTALPDGYVGLTEHKSTRKLVKNSLQGWGKVLSSHDQALKTLPVRLFLDDGKVIRALVGRELRGFSPDKNAPMIEAPKIAFFPEDTALYLADSDLPATLDRLFSLLDSNNKELVSFFPSILEEIPGKTELLIRTAPERPPGFTFVVTPKPGFKLDYNRFDKAIMQYLGKLDPKMVQVELKDGTSSFEKRSSGDSVEIRDKTLSTGALYRRFTSYSGSASIVYLIDDLGVIWLSNEPDVLKNLLLASLNSKYDSGACSMAGQETSLTINPASYETIAGSPASLIDWVRGFSSVRFKLNDAETNLFTICGYF